MSGPGSTQHEDRPELLGRPQRRRRGESQAEGRCCPRKGLASHWVALQTATPVTRPEPQDRLFFSSDYIRDLIERIRERLESIFGDDDDDDDNDNDDNAPATAESPEETTMAETSGTMTIVRPQGLNFLNLSLFIADQVQQPLETPE